MTNLGRLTISDIDRHLHKLGYVCIREHCPWGRCDVYKNLKTSVVAFLENGVLRSGHEQYLHLKECWVPQSDRDISWFMNGMEKWFNDTI